MLSPTPLFPPSLIPFWRTIFKDFPETRSEADLDLLFWLSSWKPPKLVHFWWEMPLWDCHVAPSHTRITAELGKNLGEGQRKVLAVFNKGFLLQKWCVHLFLCWWKWLGTLIKFQFCYCLPLPKSTADGPIRKRSCKLLRSCFLGR